MNHQSRNTQHASRVTVETGLWLLIIAVALALRLLHLDAAPLTPGEAREAMAAWRAVSGQGMPEGDYSPLLFAGNGLLFFVAGGSDALARLLPALAGTGLALAPALLGRRLGRVGALAMGGLLALSPTALLLSRQVDGAVFAAVGVLTTLGAALSFLDTGRPGWLYLAAGSLAVAVTAGPGVYGMLLALAVAGGLLAWLVRGKPPPQAGEGSPSGHFAGAWDAARPYLAQAAGVFLLVGFVTATAAGFNPAGLGATGDLLPAWLARFRHNETVLPLTALLVYEPLPLLFGLAGAVILLRRGRPAELLLALWAVVGAILLAAMPSRTPGDLLLVVLPLAGLAGLVVERGMTGLRSEGAWLNEGIYAAILLVLWIHIALTLARHTHPDPSTGLSNPANLALVALVLLLQLSLTAAFALAAGVRAALRGLVVVVGVVLLAVTVAAGWGVAHVRPADPRELLVVQPTAPEVRDLVNTLRDISTWHHRMPTTLPVTVEAEPDSVLAWYLRDFSAAPSSEPGPAVVAMPGDVEGVLGEGYVGQDFALTRTWRPEGIGCAAEWPPHCERLFRWLLYRQSPVPPSDERVVLWVRQDIALASPP